MRSTRRAERAFLMLVCMSLALSHNMSVPLDLGVPAVLAALAVMSQDLSTHDNWKHERVDGFCRPELDPVRSQFWI